jgi:GT2 family glycosyltransferase
MVPIYLTSFYRKDFTERSVNLINERTDPNTFKIIVYDNGSDKETKDYLCKLLEEGKICSLVLDSRNTGCLYNKIVFHAMTESNNEFYCISDNDVYPPKLSPDWLSQMIAIMKKHPEIGILTPQLPPQWLQTPYQVLEDIVYAKAVGNTFKLCRMDVMKAIIPQIDQKLGAYGDDGQVSELVEKSGYKVAFCRNIFCLHAGQTINWGYTEEQIAKDPRKAGYGEPFSYALVNEQTYEPEPKWKM